MRELIAQVGMVLLCVWTCEARAVAAGAQARSHRLMPVTDAERGQRTQEELEQMAEIFAHEPLAITEDPMDLSKLLGDREAGGLEESLVGIMKDSPIHGQVKTGRAGATLMETDSVMLDPSVEQESQALMNKLNLEIDRDAAKLKQYTEQTRNVEARMVSMVQRRTQLENIFNAPLSPSALSSGFATPPGGLTRMKQRLPHPLPHAHNALEALETGG